MFTIYKEKFLSYLRNNCNINLTNEQSEVVFNISGPMTVVAVPGSGKTTTLICRTANLILNHNVDPKKILGLSFSKASAMDMRSRFDNLFGNIVKNKVAFSTIHSFAYYVINNYSRRHNIKYTIIESKNSPVNPTILLKNIYKKYNNDFISDDKLEELSSFIGYLKNIMVSFENTEIYKNNFPVPNFMQIYKEYELFKRKNNLLDYDDMLVKCYKILNEDIVILDFYRNLYDYIEVDECQDTSKIQQEIIKLISAPKFNLCIVGDDDQSIYSWRGAFSDGLLNFKKEYHKDGKLFFIQQNFRSDKNIVITANEFIKSNKKRYNKELFTENEEGNKIKFINTKDEYDQINFLVKNLKEKSNLRETTILYRNNISSIPIVDRLIQENIPFYIKDSVPSFFNSWVVKDILSFFELAFDLTNIDAFEKIYYKMKSYVKKDDLNILYTRKIKESVFRTLYNNQGYSSANYRLKSFEEKFMKLSSLSGYKAINFIRYELNYEDYMMDYCDKFKFNINNVQTILSILAMVLSSCPTLEDIEGKLIYLKDEMEKSKYKGKFNGVTLSTMHSCKGLEFDTVYIIDLIEDIIPSPESLDKSKKDDYSDFEEETRLMYVAITRARKNLYLINTLTRNNKKCTPSIFVEKLYKISHKDSSYRNTMVENESFIQSISLKEGTIIEHNSFGIGKILSINKDIITISFENGLIKNLSYNLCINKGLLHILD